MKQLYIYIIIFFLFLFSGQVYAQQNTKEEQKVVKKEAKKEKRKRKAEKKEEKIKNGDVIITPLIGPSYSPELGGIFTVGGLLTFKTNKQDSLIQRSSLPFTISGTTTGAYTANAFLTSYWIEDKLRVNVDFAFKEMPDNYWGIGYNDAFENHKSDTTTAFVRKYMLINPKFFYKIREYLYIGLNVNFNYTKGSDAAELVANDESYKTYNDRPFNSGIGLILRYDSRDIPVDAWRGIFLEISASTFSTKLLSDNNYQAYTLDYRQYKTIKRDGQTIAWQIKSRIARGEVPYGEMSMVGTPNDLRGYTWGRYRNNDMAFAIVEYRYMFLDKEKNISQHGFVLWAGAGKVFNINAIKDDLNKWLPNAGIGYRFAVQPRMTVRLDFGVGRESSGIYFNFNQAF